uniref:Uncharacterized protein n=1 Tax=Magallana gigas TaxID=29159 RepID=K1QI04_MAGGI
MQQNCRSLDPTFNIVTAAEDDILCLYYNYTDKKFYADDCSTNRTFLCESMTTEITQEIIQEKIENIQKNLTVNKKETNQYIRTLTSAPDERQSAKNIGIVGVTVISVVFGVIMLSDCINVVKGIQNKCKRSEDS